MSVDFILEKRVDLYVAAKGDVLEHLIFYKNMYWKILDLAVLI